jgi:enamine deaminase RidA (YjgF/YER057c/UK114 family)
MEREVSYIQSANLASVDYPYASRVPAGMHLVFLAGACPIDKDGRVPFVNDYELQAKLCVDNLKQALNDSGASLRNVVYTRVFVATQNRADLVNTWNIVKREFGDHDVPSTLSGVTVLGYPNQLVEIEAIAAIAAE